MINKISKRFLIILCTLVLTSNCTEENRFHRRNLNRLATLGISGFFDHDPYQFCKSIVPNFIGKYPSGKNPSRTCIHYQYYTCHITHYCPNLPTETERKKCEQDANDYWLRPWDNAKGDRIKKVAISKKVCDSEASKNTQK